MDILVVALNGSSAEEAAAAKLQQVKFALQNSGRCIQDALLWTTRNHFRTIYPDSNHYNPDKVTPNGFSFGDVAEGRVDIDVPGITRAYHDLDIKPINSRHLTIPIHREAYGKKSSSFDNTFVVTKKNGKKFIAKRDLSGIVFLYFLAERVHQRQDTRLMPSDLTLADNISSRIIAALERATV